jgi:glycerophosphoryl diester phosphodiesterase
MEKFVVYAHRGASEYYPENTLSSFAAGIDMGADGIETDVQISKDGVLMIYHDDCMKDKTGFEGSICDYTYEQLRAARVKNEKYGREDCLMTFEDFLKYFAWRDLTLAIELKVEGIGAKVIDMLRKYNALDKSIVTSFKYPALVECFEYDKSVKLGWLYVKTTAATFDKLAAINAYQACPKAQDITPEDIASFKAAGLECRAWGVANTDIMKYAAQIGVDGGMTVNFPDKLIEYIKNNK